MRSNVVARALMVCAMLGLGFSGVTPFVAKAQEAPGPLRVLFVGNSLTYSNDLPAMVQTVAEAMGHRLEVSSTARPNYSLEDHWYAGVGQRIEAARADVVVFQQGPSSLPENQEHLDAWARRLAPIVRAAGGIPAFYMVWPSEDRLHALDAVRDAYAGAAEATEGLLMPAGAVWGHIRARDPSIRLFGPDRFHPAPLGTAVAALTIARVLLDESVAGLAGLERLEPRTPGLPVVELGEAGAIIVASIEAVVGR